MPQHVWQVFSNMVPELGMIFLTLSDAVCSQATPFVFWPQFSPHTGLIKLHSNNSSRTTCLHIDAQPTGYEGKCVHRVLWWENELDEVFVGNIWASTVYQRQHGISISLSTKKGAKHLQDCNGTVLWSILCCRPWKRQFESRRCKASPYLSNFWLFTTFQTSHVHQAY